MTESEILEQVAQVIRETFGVDGIEVTRATVAGDIPGWDSLSHTVLVLSIEQAFQVELPPSIQYQNVGDLVDTLEACLARVPHSAGP
jgi:acyl carrier protein